MRTRSLPGQQVPPVVPRSPLPLKTDRATMRRTSPIRPHGVPNMRHFVPASVSLVVLAISCSSQTRNSEPPSPPISWIQFQDPAEQAFRAQVPRDWKVTGGLYRFGQLDPRLMVDMVSPDGKIDIRIGDYRVPPFAPLTPALANLGFREGSRYTPRNVAQEVIANYRPGWVFADVYGQGRFGPLCRHLSLKSMRKEDPVHQAGPNDTITAGEVVYACDSGSGPQVGYAFAETQYFPMQSSGVWMVSWLYSFIAPQSQAADALKIVLHSLSTLEIDPRWEYRQLMMNGSAGQGAMDDFHKTMDQIHSDYERRTAASQSQFEQIDRAIRGVDLTTDPIDGKQREVWTGTGAPHWINGLGQIADSVSKPSSDSRRLNNQP